jgi:ADP-heptose:LPS heptosyltransferase
MPGGSASVLIIRLDAIGDALALTPLLAALGRRGLPVDVVLGRENAGVFASRAIRESLVAEFALRSNAPSNLAAIQKLGRELRARNYTHVLVPTEDPAGYRLAGSVGAPARIGFVNTWGKPFKALWARRFLSTAMRRSAGLDPRAPHECEVLFKLGTSLLGDKAPPRETAELRPLVLDCEPEPDQRVAVQITAKWQRLGLALDDVVKLVRRIAAGGTPALLAARREAAYAELVARSTGIAVTYFDDLQSWKAAIGAAPAIVTPDSGALHVAGMIGTPVVAVFPAQRGYALQVARWAPWAAPHRIVKAERGWPEIAGEALAQLLSS